MSLPPPPQPSSLHHLVWANGASLVPSACMPPNGKFSSRGTANRTPLPAENWQGIRYLQLACSRHIRFPQQTKLQGSIGRLESHYPPLAGWSAMCPRHDLRWTWMGAVARSAIHCSLCPAARSALRNKPKQKDGVGAGPSSTPRNLCTTGQATTILHQLPTFTCSQSLPNTWARKSTLTGKAFTASIKVAISSCVCVIPKKLLIHSKLQHEDGIFKIQWQNQRGQAEDRRPQGRGGGNCGKMRKDL